MTEPIRILDAQPEDLPAILYVQKEAFGEVARRYGVTDLPPLHQTIDEIRAEFEEAVFLKAVDNGGIVGSVRGYVKDTDGHIDRLVVLPNRQNEGIGTKLMEAIEDRLRSQVDRFELFTGTRDEKNHHLYEKLGYRRFSTRQLNEQVTLALMEKSAD